MAYPGLPGNLPADLTTFVGRRSELDDLSQALAASRLVTVTGVGGVGKTRLAMRAALQARDRFADDVWLVELAALQSGDLLGQAIVSALGIRDQSSRWTIDSLVKHIVGKRMLIILDNCEHLQDASADAAGLLLRSCPGLHILATSRHALRVAGERTLTLRPLRYPEGGAETANIHRFEAVQLFEERARLVLSDFAVTASNAQVVTRLCQRLEGIPLALELAAAKLRVLSIGQLVERLEDRLSLASDSDRSVQPRHQALRTVMEWSYELCTDSEKALWARLSVFADSCDLNSAEGVCSSGDLPEEAVFDAIVGLLDKSILARSERDGQVRYSMLEAIKQYGQETLRSSGRELEFRRRHRDWYLGVTREFRMSWFGPDQALWFGRMRVDHSNFRAALQFCLDSKRDPTLGMEIALGLSDYWRAGGLLSEARSWFERLLETGGGLPDLRGRVIATAGYLALVQGDVGSAEGLLSDARSAVERYASEGKHVIDVPECFAALFRGEFSAHIRACQRFVERDQSADELPWLATGYVVLGLGSSVSERDGDAVTYWTRLLELCDAHGETWRKSYALWGLGIEAWKRGDLNQARTLERESLALQHHVFEDYFCAALCAEALAWIASSEDRDHEAARLFGVAQMLRHETTTSLYVFFGEIHVRCEKKIRKSLGDEAYRRAFDAGTRLTVEQAIGGIINGRPAVRVPDVSDPVSLLTEREWEVADLVAKGLTNKQIAGVLTISQRTVETHVQNVLSKLDCRSRHLVAPIIATRRAESTWS